MGNNWMLQVHDIFDPLPEFMHRADVIFSDIPYNQGMITNYINRPNVRISEHNTRQFDDFLRRFFECVAEISPRILFVETGKDALADVIMCARNQFKYVTFYNATYYHKSINKAYIVHATNTHRSRRYAELEDMDEEDAIAWICQRVPYSCIGDLLMGKGLVGWYAYQANRPFVGVELNPDRLNELKKRLASKEAKIEVTND